MCNKESCTRDEDRDFAQNRIRMILNKVYLTEYSIVGRPHRKSSFVKKYSSNYFTAKVYLAKILMTYFFYI